MQYFIQIYAIVTSALIDIFIIVLPAITIVAIMEIMSPLKHCLPYKEINTLYGILIFHTMLRFIRFMWVRVPNPSYNYSKSYKDLSKYMEITFLLWHKLLIIIIFCPTITRRRKQQRKVQHNKLCVFFSPLSFCGLITWFKYTLLPVVRLTRAHKVDKQLILIGKLSGKNKK